MSKELRALERIKDFMSANAHHWKQDIGMIETTLKRLEKFDVLLEDNIFDNLETGRQLINYIFDLRRLDKKKLKALEIIKKKPMLTPCIFMHETYEEYIKEYGEWNEVKEDTCYTKEEFDLLKEVLK